MKGRVDQDDRHDFCDMRARAQTLYDDPYLSVNAFFNTLQALGIISIHVRRRGIFVTKGSIFTESKTSRPGSV